MKFWDTSALVPLVIAERTSDTVRPILRADPNVVVSFLTPVELESAIQRRASQAGVTTGHARTDFLHALEQAWTIVDDHVSILRTARRLTGIHRLRAGDAIQLASALAAEREPARLQIVSLDEELRTAARAERFVVLP